MRRISPREVDVDRLMQGHRPVWLTHEAAAVLGFASAEGFLRSEVRSGKLRPVRRSSPLGFSRLRVMERAGVRA